MGNLKRLRIVAVTTGPRTRRSDFDLPVASVRAPPEKHGGTTAGPGMHVLQRFGAAFLPGARDPMCLLLAQ